MIITQERLVDLEKLVNHIRNEHGYYDEKENIDYVFRQSQRQLEIAGITQAIVGIKRESRAQECARRSM